MSRPSTTGLKARLDSLYRRFNRRSFVHPDPLELVYRYDSPEDQEIAALVCACLAYGRVAQILSSIAKVLDVMQPGPRAYLERTPKAGLRPALSGFKHRFTTGAEMAALLRAVKLAVESTGSLEALFAAGMGRRDDTVLPGLAAFVDRLRGLAGGERACPSLLSSPADGSACKRLNLYLRWMARKDAVDPGPWHAIPPAKLVVPLDTHMFRIASGLGLTARKQPNLATALEITRAFARYDARDPVRYDFSLTRLGINPACRDEGLERLLRGRE